MKQFAALLKSVAESTLSSSDTTVSVETFHVPDVFEEEAKKIILAALADPFARIAVNYHMATARQSSGEGKPPLGGHLSPIVGYLPPLM